MQGTWPQRTPRHQEDTNEQLAVRGANLTPHQAVVVRPNGKVVSVKNLGWLLQQGYQGKSPEIFRVYAPILPNTGAAVLVALYEDGTVYATMWQDATVMRRWLDRPTFAHVPIDWRVDLQGIYNLYAS